jgi:stage V sporulation protein G
MKPTEIRVNLVKKSDSKIKAFANVTFDELLVVKGIRVMDTGNGLWVAMPSEKNIKDNKFYENVYILNARDDGSAGQEFSQKLNAAILRKYQEAIGESGDGGGKQGSAPPKSGNIVDDGVPF